jgi:hypothetical protein
MMYESVRHTLLWPAEGPPMELGFAPTSLLEERRAALQATWPMMFA